MKSFIGRGRTSKARSKEGINQHNFASKKHLPSSVSDEAATRLSARTPGGRRWVERWERNGIIYISLEIRVKLFKLRID